LLVNLGAIPVDVPVDTLCNVGFDFGHGVTNRTRNTDRGLISNPIDIETDAALTVISGETITVFKGLADCRDIFKSNDRTVGGTDDRDASEILCPIATICYAQQDVATSCLNRSAGKLR
jgi:hypothetical protein